jgi:hypothetical protein
MSSYFQSIRRLKDSHFYINALANQFALWKATQDQVDNPIYKAFSRATTNRLIFREQAAAPVLRGAEFWKPMVPSEPGPVGPIGAPPSGTVTVMINFDHELEDRSGKKNHAIFEFTNNQLLFADGQNQDLSFAVNFNPTSNSTYDKLWIPFSPTTQIVYDTSVGFSIFTRIMPTTLSAIGQVDAPAPRTNKVQYWGGPVHNKYRAEIINIYWGTEWDSGDYLTRRNQMNQAMDVMCNGDHFKGFWQYANILPPIRSTTHGNIHRNTNCPDRVWTDEADSIISTMVDASTIPNPGSFGEPSSMGSFDYRHIIFITVPEDTTLCDPSLTLCGGAFTWHLNKNGVWINYCVEPYNVVPSGNQYSALQMQSQGFGHEVVHAISGAGFGGPGDTIYGGVLTDGGSSPQHPMADGQNCGAQLRELQNTSVGGRRVLTEMYWSDMDGKCIAPGSGESWTPAPTQTGPIVRRYIFQKLDDLDNGATAAVGEDGTVYFNVKKAGVEYKVKSAAAALVVNSWADCWFTWNTATNTPAIYINNVKYTTASTEALLWNNTHSHSILANYNMGATIGQFRGRMDDFRLYRSALVDDTQVDTFAGNGLTITGGLNSPPTAEEGVFIVNRVKIDKQLENTGIFVPADVESGDVPAAIASFTSTSFSSTSFTL